MTHSPFLFPFLLFRFWKVLYVIILRIHEASWMREYANMTSLVQERFVLLIVLTQLPNELIFSYNSLMIIHFVYHGQGPFSIQWEGRTKRNLSKYLIMMHDRQSI